MRSKLKWLMLPLLLTGCTGVGLAEVIKAAAQDPASVCINVTSIYGAVKFARTNIINGNMNCTQEGLSVKSDAAQVGVPMVVVPQVTIGAPSIK